MNVAIAMVIDQAILRLCLGLSAILSVLVI